MVLGRRLISLGQRQRPLCIWLVFSVVPIISRKVLLTGIASGYTWTGPSLFASLTLPDGELVCNYYGSLGTSNSEYFIILIGDQLITEKMAIWVEQW